MTPALQHHDSVASIVDGIHAGVFPGRPAAEPPYQAVCEGIIDFGLRHRDLLDLVNNAEGELEIPLDGPQRPLIDFEDTLTEVLREEWLAMKSV